MNKALVIGGGFTGCTAALELSKLHNFEVDLIEKSNFLGAGNRTQYYKGHPYTFGPRHFLTRNEKLFSYLNKYVPLRSCSDHQFLTLGKNQNNFINYPLNFNDIDKLSNNKTINSELSNIFLQSVANSGDTPEYQDYINYNLAKSANNFEEFWIKSIGKHLYDEFINDYSKKMWMLNDNKMIDDFTWSPKGVTIKKGGPECWSDAISAYPYAITGYDDFFRISTKDVNVYLNTIVNKYDVNNKTITIDGISKKYDVIINTTPLDKIFNDVYGELPYIGRDLIKILFPMEYVLPKDTYFLYYAGDESYTRIVEYKKFTKYKSDNTLITIEIPSTRNKHYPLPIKKYIDIQNKYLNDLPENFYSIGRAGSYMYNVDIDDAIDQALTVVNLIK